MIFINAWIPDIDHHLIMGRISVIIRRITAKCMQSNTIIGHFQKRLFLTHGENCLIDSFNTMEPEDS